MLTKTWKHLKPVKPLYYLVMLNFRLHVTPQTILACEKKKKPEHFKDRVTAANSIGRLTYYRDKAKNAVHCYNGLSVLLCCVTGFVQLFIKDNAIVRSWNSSAKFNFTRQCLNPEILMQLSEFFHRESISRPTSCQSVMIDGQETPVRYLKDNVKELGSQYLLEFPNGVKHSYIYTRLPATFGYNTMLAGLCNLCDIWPFKLRQVHITTPWPNRRHWIF